MSDFGLWILLFNLKKGGGPFDLTIVFQPSNSSTYLSNKIQLLSLYSSELNSLFSICQFLSLYDISTKLCLQFFSRKKYYKFTQNRLSIWGWIIYIVSTE